MTEYHFSYLTHIDNTYQNRNIVVTGTDNFFLATIIAKSEYIADLNSWGSIELNKDISSQLTTIQFLVENIPEHPFTNETFYVMKRVGDILTRYVFQLHGCLDYKRTIVKAIIKD